MPEPSFQALSDLQQRGAGGLARLCIEAGIPLRSEQYRHVRGIYNEVAEMSGALAVDVRMERDRLQRKVTQLERDLQQLREMSHE